MSTYNFNLGDVLCGEPDLRYTFTCVAVHCAGQTKKTRCHLQRSVWVCAHWRCSDRFSVQCPRICTGFQRPSGYIVRYSVLCSRTVPAGGCFVNAGVCMYQMKRSVKQHPQH